MCSVATVAFGSPSLAYILQQFVGNLKQTKIAVCVSEIWYILVHSPQEIIVRKDSLKWQCSKRYLLYILMLCVRCVRLRCLLVNFGTHVKYTWTVLYIRIL